MSSSEPEDPGLPETTPDGGPRPPDRGEDAERTEVWDALHDTAPDRAKWAEDDAPGPPPSGELDGVRPGSRLDRLWTLAREQAAGVRAGAETTAPKAGEHPEVYARRLVRSGRLTAYQAAAVLQWKSKGLAVGNYAVLDKIGAGAMGMVFKARHRTLGRVVALKILPPSFTRDSQAVHRFLREARAAAHLSHPNVVKGFDADESMGLYFLVMEYVDGPDLARVVREEGPLAVGRAVDCVLQAARGLREAHANGVVHRDVKPSNLLVDASGAVKVSDLGLVRVAAGPDAAGEHALTTDGAMMGTVDFMSPEQAYNSRLADERSDVYSLGCTLYYLLTARPPFPAETLMGRLLAHREAPIPPVRGYRPDAPPELDALLARMMAKRPEERFPTMDALVTALEGLRPGPPDSPAPTAAGRVAPTVLSPRPGGLPPLQETVVSRAVGERPPLSGLVKVVGGVVIGATLLALLFDRRRETNGELLVQADEPGLLVAIARGGVDVVPPTPRRSFTLAPGDYQVRPVDPTGPEGPTVASAVSIQRGKRSVVRFAAPAPAPPPVPAPIAPAEPIVREPESEPAPTPAPATAPQEKPGLLRTFTHGEGPVQAVAVTADGTRAVTGGNDGAVRILDLKTGASIGAMSTGAPVFAVAIDARGKFAVSAAGAVVTLWDLATRRRDGSADSVRSNALAMTPDGRLALSGGDDGLARLWTVEPFESIAELPHGGRINAVAMSRDGTRALTGGSDGKIRLWPLGTNPTRAATPTDASETREAGGKVFCLALSGDGRRFLSGCENGTITLWDAEARAPIRPLKGGPRDWVRAVAFLPDGGRALAGYQGGKLLLFDLGTGAVAHAFDEAPVGHLGLAVLPDGLHALSADEDGEIRLWRLPGPKS